MLYFKFILACLFWTYIQSQSIPKILLNLTQPNQTLLQQYHGMQRTYWLQLIQQNGTQKLKRFYYYAQYAQMYVQTHILSSNEKYHTAQPYYFNFFLISDSQQKNFVLYEWDSITDVNELFYPGQSHSFTSFVIDPKFSRNKVDIKRISSQFGEVQLDNILTSDGYSEYLHDQWVNIISFDLSLYIVFSENGLFCYDSDIDGFLKCYQHQIYGYQCETYYYYSISSYQQQSFFWQRYVAFCWKPFKNETNSGVQYLMRILGTETQGYNWILVAQLKGQALDVIEFEISDNLRRFFLKYKDFNNQTKYIGRFCYYQYFLVQEISIPPEISKFQITFQISSFHFYARNISFANQQSLWHSYYYFSNSQLILVSQSQLLKSQIEYWTHSFLAETQFDKQYDENSIPFINHYYKNDIQYYYYQEIGIDMIQQQLKSYQFLFNGQSYFNLYGQFTMSDFNFGDFNYKAGKVYWFYSYQSLSSRTIYTYFSFLSYPQIQDTLVLKGKYDILAVNLQGLLSCILTYNYQSKIAMIIKLNSQTNKFQTFYQKNFKLKLTGSEYYVIASQCLAFSIDNTVFRLKYDNKSAIFYANDTIAYTLLSASCDFDRNFQFVTSGNTLYQYFNQNYSPIISYQFGSYNIINVNQNKSKIAVLTNQQVNVSNGKYLHTLYHVQLVIFYQNQMKQWKNIDTGIQFQSTQQINALNIDQNFEIISFTYSNLSGSLSIILKIDYISGTARNISDSQKILMSIYKKQQTAVFTTSNYAYMTNISHEFIFKLNPQRQLYQTAIINQVDVQYYQNTEYVFFVQSGNQLHITYLNIYQKESVTKRVILNKFLDNYSIQIKERGILVNQVIYLCSPGCEYCFNQYMCRKCSNGYVLNFLSKRCLKCQSNCMTCNPLSLYQCYTCFPGYYFKLTTSICLSCHSSCFQCSQKTQNSCVSCFQGYYLQIVSFAVKKCLKCQLNCKNCKNSTFCNDCQYGYTASSDGQCIQCALNCNKCNSSKLTSCIQCKEGFYFQTLINPIQNITCKRCGTNCKKCQSAQICFECNEGFSLTNYTSLNATQILRKCTPLCQLPCKTCFQTNETLCKSCIEGYFLNQSTFICEQDLRCKNSASCITCPYNYNLILNRCYLCANISRCTSCYKYNFEICLSCQKGYYLEEGQCIACNPQCQQCILSNICTKCKPGFMKSITFFSKFPKCISCSSNCLTCIYSPNNCLTCSQNQYLQGTVCLSKFRILFNIKINMDFNSLNNSMIEDLKSIIMNLVGKQYSDIHFVSIKSGSAIISGTINVVNDTDQYKTMNTLSKGLSEGTYVGSNLIQASSFQGTFQSQTLIVSNQTSVNLGLILGIVIPTSIVFIAIILTVSFSIYKYIKTKHLKQLKQGQDSAFNTEKSEQQREKRRSNRVSRKVALFLPSVSLSRLSPSTENTSV